MMMNDLKGKRVLITGSSSGIGAAAAVAFASQGSRVAVHFHRNAGKAAEVVSRIEQAGGSAVLASGDLRKPSEAASLVAQAVEALGGLDVLINNAGGLPVRSSLAAYSNEAFDTIVDLNVRSLLAVTAAAYPHLKACGRGSIVNVGSIAGRNGGQPGSALYAGAKAFVHSLTKSMALEFAADKIRVNTVAPGLILTPFHDRTPKERLDAVRAAVPLGRLGESDECVGAFLFLASESMSGYLTGHTLDVNGGRLMS